MLPPIESRIAAELSVRPQQVHAAVELIDGGATVPFIARYRKEATGGLDDTQLRRLEERLGYLRELEERREAIVRSIEEQGKLTPALAQSIASAETKQRLEDLYLPYKPKRRTKAQIAREAGLEPLADALLADATLVPETEAARYVREAFTTDEGENPGVADAAAALEGARQILIERFAEDAELVGSLREHLHAHARVVSTVIEGREEKGAKFRDYFAYDEAVRDIPSHRALALFRGRKEEILRVALKLPEELAPDADPLAPNACRLRIAARFGIAAGGRAADAWLLETVRWAWTIKLAWQLEGEIFAALREQAEAEAIRVFASNLHDLLLAAPAGARATLGLDPGIRTGVKAAVVDSTGKVLDTATVYPFAPRNDREGAMLTLAALAHKHGVELISIGNGTASRETDALVAEMLRRDPSLGATKVVVSEAGASVYSASEVAAREFPTLDVTLRGAVSIARRLQDPLAELVKIDPKSIGVGQYQHDVSQVKLARSLEAVVEDCVNAVGVDVNTASPALLARVSGLSPSLAENIVRHRDAHGRYTNRASLRDVPRLGEKTFEQAAGFLRIVDGTDPLDASAVHPEAYPLVERILRDLSRPIGELMRDTDAIRRIEPRSYTDERFGLPTVQDILRELEKPGRDPRPEFRTAAFLENVQELKDLAPGMLLEGVVTNVTNFGAFVDVGVHQDGLVHVSAMAHRFVKDPREVVKAGDIVKVRVVEVDIARRRIALTMKIDAPPAAGAAGRGRDGNRGAGGRDGRDGRCDGNRDDRRGADRAGAGGRGAGARKSEYPKSGTSGGGGAADGALALALGEALKRR